MAKYTINGEDSDDDAAWKLHQEKMTELAKEIGKYDWYYEMSDDHGVWQRGLNHHNKINHMACAIGKDGETLWNAHRTIHYGPHSGFCYR